MPLAPHGGNGRSPTAVIALATKPAHAGAIDGGNLGNRCRTNSRRGITDPAQRSYPPVESVCRALDVLRAVNKLGIASVSAVFDETGLPKPTIVRMLETLSAEGYVARDNMCGGYRVTSRVHELHSGYQGVARVIEIARPLAIDLTQRIKWPIGIGVIDGDAIALKFWTGSISPWAHTNTVLGLRPDLVSTAMGRAYLAYCPADARERHLSRLRAERPREFGEVEERQLRAVLDQVVAEGFAMRDPRTKPYRTTTLAMPIRQGGEVHALISISFFTTAVPRPEIGARVVTPLRETVDRIEAAFAVANGMPIAPDAAAPNIEPDF